MDTDTVHGSAQYRLLNALDFAGRPCRAATLLSDQNANTDDLLWLVKADLVAAHPYGKTTTIDLVEFLGHHGSLMMVDLTLTLTSAARKTLNYPRNRMLRHLWARRGKRAPLRRLMTETGAQPLHVDSAHARGQITLVFAESGEPVQKWAIYRPNFVRLHNVTARLTDKGRQFLPF